MKFVKVIFSLAITLGLVYILDNPLAPAPALGPFLSPFTGFWQNGEKAAVTGDERLVHADSLHDEVIIRYDDTGVPHIFAKNNFDLYFAQGYVTARDRLWQMDLQTRAASGRLSEILGERTLTMDLQSRRLGMTYGAEENIRAAMLDPRSREALLGYTAGINAYIRQLAPKDYPIEFKLLGYKPELWKPVNTMYMLEQMTLNLAGRSNDLAMTHVLNHFGADITANLFPDYPMVQESPVIPAGTPWNFEPLPVLEPVAARTQRGGRHTFHPANALAAPDKKPEGIGSNNWAVSAEKSATGYPILANDPHLDLSLPSIWYQAQLHAPGLNVYGVALPGVPGIVIGFNERVAWGVTNTDADVFDLYKINFKDADRKVYWHDHQWKATSVREETIFVKGRAPVKEQIVYTHHGPVTDSDHTEPFPNLAVKWIGHEPGNSLMTFYDLNRSANYDDYRKALTSYVGPAQNFAFADNSKNIAITVNGKLPLKYKDQGKFILDGSNADEDWQGWIPAEQNPFIRNPARGFVSSANQSSTDPTYPYYINWVFAPSERAIRINERLQSMSGATADSLRMLQNDNLNILARTLLPTLLPIVEQTKLNVTQRAARILLSNWNLENSAGSVPASIFEEWMPLLRQAIWADDLEGGMEIPTRDRTTYLILHEPGLHWFDDKSTPGKETREDIVAGTFKAALDSLAKKHGPMSQAWQWGQVKNTEIRHLSRSLAAFNAPPVISGGGSGIVNATTQRKGPSWRMVVELGRQPRAFGIYPGGQSGNPGSPFYLNLLPKWEAGELNELVFLTSAGQQNPRMLYSLSLKKHKDS
ncbi:penicillin acylase family protein [Dyadobacter sandarakinus]|uniref:Penicillin acylase family protein n=1 Tax=Dyadobacter sandarakinus TaxID=2747268 RepID=A0ABX7I986_9BACT|nr:penicillin acylase family protein [Dyadobacter sandarakinus]QRR02666.1 penicillin acylase family protein [Dyadobacter sandarakinus]